jgi:probable phosphomutase (TIGR03848 family)
MAIVMLVRHGRTTANASGLLAGRTSGVLLDETGEVQAKDAGERLAAVPLAAIVTSPLERCVQTAAAIAAANVSGREPQTDDALLECHYGDWQGRLLKDLVKEKLWKTIQAQPSAVEFPGGETMPEMQRRAATAVRRHDARIEAEYGAHAVWVAVSHGDPIKSVLADALGMHLDLFQRINVDPGSISIVRYTVSRPYVLAVNTHAGDLSWLKPPAKRPTTRAASRKGRRKAADTSDMEVDAPVGGGAGPASAAD